MNKCLFVTVVACFVLVACGPNPAQLSSMVDQTLDAIPSQTPVQHSYTLPNLHSQPHIYLATYLYSVSDTLALPHPNRLPTYNPYSEPQCDPETVAEVVAFITSKGQDFTVWLDGTTKVMKSLPWKT
jgi:hypothetical protein